MCPQSWKTNMSNAARTIIHGVLLSTMHGPMNMQMFWSSFSLWGSYEVSPHKKTTYIHRIQCLSVYKLTWPAWRCPRPNPHAKPFGTWRQHKRPRKQLWISELCILSAMHARVGHTCQIAYPPARYSGDNLFCESNLESWLSDIVSVK
jgi:hypothetical protein